MLQEKVRSTADW